MEHATVLTMELLISGVTIVVNILVFTIGGTWKLSELKASLVKAIGDSKEEVEQKQNTHQNKIDGMIADLHDRIQKQSLYNIETFQRRDEAQKAIDQIASVVRTIGDNLEKRLDRLETKIDGRA